MRFNGIAMDQYFSKVSKENKLTPKKVTYIIEKIWHDLKNLDKKQGSLYVIELLPRFFSEIGLGALDHK